MRPHGSALAFADGRPNLSSYAKIHRKPDCCVLVDERGWGVSVLHPSEAFLLSLMVGTLTVGEIADFAATVYGLDVSHSRDLVDSLVRKTAPFLSYSGEASSNHHHNPAEFLYKPLLHPDNETPLQTPAILNIVLSRACNFACAYCFVRGMSTNASLTEQICLSLVAQASKLGVSVVALAGGEPMLYRSFHNVLSAVIGAGVVPFVSTNGSLLSKKNVELMKTAGLVGIQVSIDSSDPPIHDQLTRSRNTLPAVVGGIKRLKDVGIAVRTKSVITSVSKPGLQELIGLLIDLGVDQIHLAMETSASCQSNNCSPSQEMSEAELSEIKSIAAMVSGSDRVLLSNLNKKWTAPRDIIRCGSLFAGLVVHPNGSVTACELIDDQALMTFGNVYEEKLSAIWLGERHRKLSKLVSNRNTVDAKCADCSALSDCGTGCFNASQIAYGNLLSHDPRCCGPFANT